MTEREVEKKLSFARHNMECEGFIMTDKNLEDGRMILSGKLSVDEYVKNIIEKR